MKPRLKLAFKCLAGVAAVMILGLAYYLWPLFSLIYTFYSWEKKYDDVPVKKSTYIGYIVSIAPVGVLAKMHNYGSWRDRHYYLFANYFTNIKGDNSKPIETLELSGYTNFEVFDVRTMTSGQGTSTAVVCFLRSMKDHKIVFSEDCSELSAINSFTKFYKIAEKDMNQYGSIYFTARPGFNEKKPFFFKVNNLETYKANSVDEMFSFLISYDHVTSYSSLMDSFPYLMQGREKFYEHEYYKFYLPKNIAFTTQRKSSLEEIMNTNEIPKNTLAQIVSLFPDSFKNRWVLINFILLHREGLLTKRVVNCFSKHMEGSDDLDEEVSKVRLFLDSFAKDLKLESSESSDICGRLSPPTLVGDGKMIPLSI